MLHCTDLVNDWRAQVARREEHYLYELHGCFVSVATRLLTTEHDIVRSIERRKVRVE